MVIRLIKIYIVNVNNMIAIAEKIFLKNIIIVLNIAVIIFVFSENKTAKYNSPLNLIISHHAVNKMHHIDSSKSSFLENDNIAVCISVFVFAFTISANLYNTDVSRFNIRHAL